MGSYSTGDLDLLPLKFLPVSITASGDLVTAVAGYRIRVLGFAFTMAGTTPSIKFQSNATTDLTGTLLPTAGTFIQYSGGYLAPAFQTAIGEKLSCVVAGTTPSIQGFIVYCLVNV
jgi:hypothetical protein